MKIVFNIKYSFALFDLHRYVMQGLKKTLQNPFFKNLTGTKNFILYKHGLDQKVI